MFEILKNIFSDMILPYRSFFSWLRVKLLTFILGLLLGVFFALPFLLFALFYAWNYQLDFKWEFSQSGILNLSLIIIYTAIVLGYFYNFMVLGKYYLKLKENGKKEKFKVLKHFFKRKTIQRFMLLNIIFGTSALVLAFLGILILNLIKDFYGFETSVILASSSVFSAFSIILVSFTLIVFYIFYRVIFSYTFVLDEEVGAIKSIKKSFKHTSGFTKLISSLVIFLIFATIYLPFYNLERNFEKESGNVQSYLIMLKNGVPEKYENLFSALKLRYNGKTEEELLSHKKNLDYILYAIIVWYFILFFGMGTMLYISIYNNIIKK
ncbi:hypothetical protein HG430_003825 [Candidatus Gracilibacteria bacterium]|nr:hypothetical protein [Candidatus Gracilibacteria bacterium]